MDNTEGKLQIEVQELKAEVRQLKLFIHGILAVAGVVVICAFPQIAVAAIAIGFYILFALLVSPVRHLVFPSIFRSQQIVNRKSQI